MPCAALIPHPSTVCPQVDRVEVRIPENLRSGLALYYRIEGELDRLRIPRLREPRCADGLWQHTCFEAFLGTADASGYYELNFAPSMEWSAYRFDAYRRGMTRVQAVTAPVPAVRRSTGRLELDVCIVLDELPWLSPGVPIRLALSAVIEGTDGVRSYWAVHHSPGKPDFHHPDSFALRLDRT